MSLIDIGKVNRMFEDAVRAQDPDRLASLYTGTAMALPPDGPIVRGQDGIRQLWSTVMKDMGLRDVTLKTVDLDVDGDTACEVGHATLSLDPPGGQPATANVKYVVVWQRSAGRWRLHRDIWNAEPPDGGRRAAGDEERHGFAGALPSAGGCGGPSRGPHSGVR